MKLSLQILFQICLLLAIVIGCRKSIPSDIPPLNPVTITVTLDGKPLANASLTLELIDAASGFAVVGKTESNGVAALWTQGRYEGVPAGKYKVIVRKTVFQEGQTSKMPPPTDPQKLAAYNQKIIAERKSVSILEEQFSHPQKTILELEVVPGQKTKKTFEVKQIPGTPPI